MARRYILVGRSGLLLILFRLIICRLMELSRIDCF